MALRPFLLLLLLLLAATFSITRAQGIGNSALDCCLNHSHTTIPRSLVTSYRYQEPESACLLRAVVFTTRRNRTICASPTNEAVQKLIKYLNKKAKNEKDKKAKNDTNKKRPTPRLRRKPKKQKRQQV